MRNVANGFCLVTALSALALWASPAGAAEVVIPNVNESTPGPSNQAFPYNQGVMRVQQVLDASQLGGLVGAVTKIAFRVDEEFGTPFNMSGIDTEVRLSHTNVEPTAMSLTFADNYGPDVTLVYDGLLTLSSDGSGAFDIVIDIGDAFIYNGTQNLLVEYKVFNSSFTTQFDAAGTGYGEGGTPWIDRVWAFDPNATTGSSDGDDGYVTQLTIEGTNATESFSWGRVKSEYVGK
jgi:hypothetical protein